MAIPVTKVSRIRRKIKHLVHWRTVLRTVSLVSCSGTFTRFLTFVYRNICVGLCFRILQCLRTAFCLQGSGYSLFGRTISGIFGGFLNKVSFWILLFACRPFIEVLLSSWSHAVYPVFAGAKIPKEIRKKRRVFFTIFANWMVYRMSHASSSVFVL